MAGAFKPYDTSGRIQTITQGAVDRYDIKEDQLHIGHIMLGGLYSDPEYVHQIDAATEEKHTNVEVASISTKLADAMNQSGLKTGDHMVIMGPNNIWTSLPLYAAFYNGYATCAVDASLPYKELEVLFSDVRPKIVFCSTISEESVHKVLASNNLKSRVVTFQGPYNLEAFIKEFNGKEEGFKPPLFDTKETNALLILTSGTTGMPKAAIVSYETVYQNIMSWWKEVPIRIDRVFSVSSIQWLSSLIYFVGSPILGWTRIQTSTVATTRHIREIINKYKPQFTVFAPFLMRQFLHDEGDACDMSCFLVLGLAGSPVDPDMYSKLKEKVKGLILELYAMTETLGSPFRYVPNTPKGSLGLAIPAYKYKLIDDDGNEISEPYKVGELWWTGGHFFKGYLNNPEETAQTLTPDGWIITGDLMSRDENNFYYFHERKKLVLKYKGMQVAPLEIENVIKQHPKVSEAVVVGIPDVASMNLLTAAIMTTGGVKVDPKEIFELVNKELPIHKRLHGGLYFVKDYPLTAAGKIKRPAVLQQAIKAKKIMDPNSSPKRCCTIV